MARLLDRYVLFYPMRFVGATFLILITVLHVAEGGRFGAFHVVLIGVLLVHPHVVFLLRRRYDRRRVETIAFLVDAFLLGLVLYVTGFSLLPSLILVTVALANALAVNGFGHMLFSGLALAAGVTLPMVVSGPNVDPRDSVAIDAACSVFLFVYFNFFAYSAYNRSRLLEQSQAELRDQKTTLEIEKARTDRLLLNLVPGPLADELAREGRLEPAVFDRVTLLAVDLPGFSAGVEREDPRELVAHLTHCFKAFDAITLRHGLEKVKTMGEVYLAAAGLPRPGTDDAAASIRAAFEIQDYMRELVSAREAHALGVLQARVGVHSGRVVGALVDTAKVSYEIWGAAVQRALQLMREADPAQVLISGQTREIAGEDGLAWESRGSLEEPGGEVVVVYEVARLAP